MPRLVRNKRFDRISTDATWQRAALAVRGMSGAVVSPLVPLGSEGCSRVSTGATRQREVKPRHHKSHLESTEVVVLALAPLANEGLSRVSTGQCEVWMRCH